MIIILNKGAIAVILLSLILLSPVALMWKYDIIEESTMLLAGSWLLFTASFIGIKAKLNDRLFYLFPTWIFTFPFAIYSSYNFFGKVMSFTKILFLIILSILILIVLLAFIALFIKEKKRKKNLQKQEIKIPLKDDGNLMYWNGIKDLFYFPIFYKWTDEIYDYNIKVLQYLKDNNVDIKYCDDFATELNKIKTCIFNGENEPINSKIKKDFFAEIDHQIKTWRNF